MRNYKEMCDKIRSKNQEIRLHKGQLKETKEIRTEKQITIPAKNSEISRRTIHKICKCETKEKLIDSTSQSISDDTKGSGRQL